MILVGMLALIGWLLRGSSFAHYVLIESMLLLAIAAPVTGWQAASDLNRKFDRSESVIVSLEILDKHRIRRRKSAAIYQVGVKYDGPERPYAIPGSIDVETDIFEQARPGRLLEVTIGGAGSACPGMATCESATRSRNQASSDPAANAQRVRG
jgi:hypothetical protein